MKQASAIGGSTGLGEAALPIGLSLLFADGSRPDAAAVRALAQSSGDFAVSHDPSQSASPGTPQGEEGWLEVLAHGLTFDLSGVSPAAAAPLPDRAYLFDIAVDSLPANMEAIRLAPGPHLAGGERMLPVVRAMAGLAAVLCALPGLVAIAWHPARSWIGPRYFTSIIGNWLEGGVFPGLGLVGLAQVADGGMQSEGLAFFTGQELRIEPELTADRASAAKIAVRLIDRLVAQGKLEQPEQVEGPDGRLYRIEPSANNRLVRVWSAS